MANKTQAAEPVFEIDRQARDLFAPHRKTPAVKAIKAFGDIGDQNPQRLVCLGVFALGLVRKDARMMRAGARMLLAHELATLAKNAVKHRVDRTRPRQSKGRQHRPRKGRKTAKEETSFPSGHSAGSMAVASAFAAEYPQHRAPALGLGAAIGLAQIPTCAHYPSDVGAGMTLGAAIERLLRLVWRPG